MFLGPGYFGYFHVKIVWSRFLLQIFISTWFWSFKSTILISIQNANLQ